MNQFHPQSWELGALGPAELWPDMGFHEVYAKSSSQVSDEGPGVEPSAQATSLPSSSLARIHDQWTTLSSTALSDN